MDDEDARAVEAVPLSQRWLCRCTVRPSLVGRLVTKMTSQRCSSAISAIRLTMPGSVSRSDSQKSVVAASSSQIALFCRRVSASAREAGVGVRGGAPARHFLDRLLSLGRRRADDRRTPTARSVEIREQPQRRLREGRWQVGDDAVHVKADAHGGARVAGADRWTATSDREREQHRVARHLQAELEDRLRGDAGQPGHGADAQPAPRQRGSSRPRSRRRIALGTIATMAIATGTATSRPPSASICR